MKCRPQVTHTLAKNPPLQIQLYHGNCCNEDSCLIDNTVLCRNKKNIIVFKKSPAKKKAACSAYKSTNVFFIYWQINISGYFFFCRFSIRAVPLRAAAENSQSKSETEVTKEFLALWYYSYPFIQCKILEWNWNSHLLYLWNQYAYSNLFHSLLQRSVKM